MTVLTVLAPVTGTVVDVSEVEDPVFAAGLVGPGLAIEPDGVRGGEAVAPITGKIVKLHPHAFVVQHDEGRRGQPPLDGRDHRRHSGHQERSRHEVPVVAAAEVVPAEDRIARRLRDENEIVPVEVAASDEPRAYDELRDEEGSGDGDDGGCRDDSGGDERAGVRHSSIVAHPARRGAGPTPVSRHAAVDAWQNR